MDDHYFVVFFWKDDLEMSSDGRALAERPLFIIGKHALKMVVNTYKNKILEHV